MNGVLHPRRYLALFTYSVQKNGAETILVVRSILFRLVLGLVSCTITLKTALQSPPSLFRHKSSPASSVHTSHRSKLTCGSTSSPVQTPLDTQRTLLSQHVNAVLQSFPGRSRQLHSQHQVVTAVVQI